MMEGYSTVEKNRSADAVASIREKENQGYFYPIIESPEFLETMRRIQESDPVHADLMNALFQQLLNNDRVLKAEKSEKTKQKETTLAIANWTGEIAPYSYTVELEEVTETNNVEIVPPQNLTMEQYVAWIEAGLVGGNQTIGSFTLLAYGEKPAIELPIVILVRGD